jgi:hypothetical protein
MREVLQQKFRVLKIRNKLFLQQDQAIFWGLNHFTLNIDFKFLKKSAWALPRLAISPS